MGQCELEAEIDVEVLDYVSCDLDVFLDTHIAAGNADG